MIPLKFQTFLKKSLIIVVRMYITICIILYFFQDSLIFFPEPTLVDRLSANIQSLMIPTDGVILEGYIERSAGTGSILYFPGNAEEVSPFIGSTTYSGNLIAFNYRGYGKSTGKPSEEALFHDALVIYDTLVNSGVIDPKHTVIMGRSLGTGVASYLASKRASAGLILITPFDSLESVASEKYSIFPIWILLKHKFLSTTHLRSYHGPTLIVSGGQDTVILNNHTDTLIKTLSGKVQTLRIPLADHNNIMDFTEADIAIREFFITFTKK